MDFRQFPRNNMYVSIPGKLTEINLHSWLFSNPCGKVLIIVGISWSPDLRVQHMEFSSMAANVSLWVVDGDEFNNTQSTWLSKACHFMCPFTRFLEMKPSSHRAHSYAFSWVWIFICSCLSWVPGHIEHNDMDCPQPWLFLCLCILFQEMKHLPHRAGQFRIRRFRFVRLLPKGKPVSYRRVCPSVREVSPWESSWMS